MQAAVSGILRQATPVISPQILESKAGILQHPPGNGSTATQMRGILDFVAAFQAQGPLEIVAGVMREFDIPGTRPVTVRLEFPEGTQGTHQLGRDFEFVEARDDIGAPAAHAVRVTVVVFAQESLLRVGEIGQVADAEGTEFVG